MGTRESIAKIYELEARFEKAACLLVLFTRKGVDVETVENLDEQGWQDAANAAGVIKPSPETRRWVIKYMDIDRAMIRDQAKDAARPGYEAHLGRSEKMADGHTAHFVGIYSIEHEDDFGDLHDEMRIIDDESYWATVVNGVIYSAALLEDLQDEYAGVKA